MTPLRIVVVLVLTARLASALEMPDVTMYYGKKRATLGAWFGKLTLGTLDAAAPAQPPSGAEVSLVTTGRRLDGIDIHFTAESCVTLERDLTRQWGTPKEEGWLETSGTQGAKLETLVDLDQGCRLHFFRRVSAKAWLNTSRKSVVPIWALGKPLSELEASIAELDPQHEDQEIRWDDTGIDGTHVSLMATVVGKRVSAVSVSTEFDAHIDAVWQRLVAIFGAPDPVSTEEDSYVWRWPRALHVECSTFVGDWPVAPIGQPSRTPPPPARPRDPGFPLSITFSRRTK